MITASVKTSRTKIIGTLCIILAAIISVVLFFGGRKAENAAESISLRVTNNEQRKEYLLSKGVETVAEPSSVENVVLPKDDATFEKYCELQKSAGFDMTPYLGKTVTKYVYPVNGEEETYVTLYVYDERIIAADIASHIDGWQKAVDGSENIG